MKRYLVAYRYGGMNQAVDTVVMRKEGPPSSEGELEALAKKIQGMERTIPQSFVHIISWSELGPEPDNVDHQGG